LDHRSELEAQVEAGVGVRAEAEAELGGVKRESSERILKQSAENPQVHNAMSLTRRVTKAMPTTTIMRWYKRNSSFAKEHWHNSDHLLRRLNKTNNVPISNSLGQTNKQKSPTHMYSLSPSTHYNQTCNIRCDFLAHDKRE
jgi:hypothetical protein